MRVISAILVLLSLIVYVVNLIFQISAHVENNHLTETVFMNSYMAETVANLDTPFTAPYWCYLVQLVVYLLTFMCVVLHCGAEVLGRGSKIPLVSIISLICAKVFDCAWVVLYNRYEILSFNVMSIVQFLLMVFGCCFVVRSARQCYYMKVSMKTQIYLKVLVMNAFFGYLAWSFFRMVSDIALGMYAYYERGYWVASVPTGVFLFGYFFYYIFDVVAFQSEFKWTISPYVVFACVFGGILSDKDLLSPEITLSGLFLSCVTTLVMVTFIHKLAATLYCHISRKDGIFLKNHDL